MATAKREVFRAPEVCELAQLQPYVLRTWEAEFPALGQISNGARLYRKADVEMVLRIKQLVFGEGLTLAGVRRRLEEPTTEPSVAAVAVDDVLGGMARSRLRQVRSGLEAIREMLAKDAGHRELQLVPPPMEKPRAVASRRAAKPAVKSASGKRRRAS